MGLVAVHRLATAMTCPARLAVMTDARRRDQRCIHQSAGANNDTALIELTRDCLKQNPVQAAAHQLGAEPHEGGALRRGLMGSKTAEATKAGPVVEGFCQAHVGKVVPGCEQERPEQGQRRPARLTLGRGRDVREQAVQLRPVHQPRYLVQRRGAAPLKATNRQLLLPNSTPRHKPTSCKETSSSNHAQQHGSTAQRLPHTALIIASFGAAVRASRHLM
jgi:hypothetical protein